MSDRDDEVDAAISRLRRWVGFRAGQKSRPDAHDQVSDDIYLLCDEIERGRE